MKKTSKKTTEPTPSVSKLKSKQKAVTAKKVLPVTSPKLSEKRIAKKKLVALKLPASKVSVVTTQAASTFITAKIDVGFGNELYIRGQGAGLSWGHGVKLDNVNYDQWSVTLSPSFERIVFKLLINDTSWCIGEDYVAAPGSHVSVVPLF
jgi:hypothetical protein